MVTGELGVRAWTAVETFIKQRATGSSHGDAMNITGQKDGVGDIEIDDQPRKSNEYEIDELWAPVEGTAHFIQQARIGSSAKPHRRALQAATNTNPDADNF